MGFWSHKKNKEKTSSPKLKQRSNTVSASSFMKFQARRLTKILRRRSTKSPKAALHRRSVFERRKTTSHVSRMMETYKEEIHKKLPRCPPPWCSECESSRASLCCELCGPTIFYCERCARAMHVGIRSKRDHVLTAHPDFETFQGYKGANDPKSPAFSPVQKYVSELRPLTALPSDPSPSTAVVFRKIHGVVSKGSMKSRPRSSDHVSRNCSTSWSG